MIEANFILVYIIIDTKQRKWTGHIMLQPVYSFFFLTTESNQDIPYSTNQFLDHLYLAVT